jgi:hypothetical protein
VKVVFEMHTFRVKVSYVRAIHDQEQQEILCHHYSRCACAFHKMSHSHISYYHNKHFSRGVGEGARDIIGLEKKERKKRNVARDTIVFTFSMSLV